MIEKHPDDDRVGDWHYKIINFASEEMREWKWLNVHADRFTRTNMKYAIRSGGKDYESACRH